MTIPANILELIDQLEYDSMEEANETGPDRDYRRMAREKKEATKQDLLEAIEFELSKGA